MTRQNWPMFPIRCCVVFGFCSSLVLLGNNVIDEQSMLLATNTDSSHANTHTQLASQRVSSCCTLPEARSKIWLFIFFSFLHDKLCFVICTVRMVIFFFYGRMLCARALFEPPHPFCVERVDSHNSKLVNYTLGTKP